MRSRSVHPGEDGFTLVELVVSVVILGIIVGAASTAIILGLRSTDDAGARLAESFDAQLVARYFVPDMQSAVSWDDRSSSAELSTGCQDSAADVLRIVSPTTTGQGTVVRYELKTVGTTKELVRHRCDFPAGPRSVTVARGMASVMARTVAGVVELAFTSASGQQWTVSSKPRPGRSLALPVPSTTSTTVVGIGPPLVSLQALDDDGDGFIEKVLATFAAPIRCTGGTCQASRWGTQGQGPSGASIGSVSVSGAVATLNLTGHSTTRSTAVSNGYRLSLSAGAGGIEAASAPFPGSSFGATNVDDRARPVLVGIDMLDVNTNGKVDRLAATFTEDLAGSTDATPWSLTGTPSGGTRGAVSTSGPVATVTVNEGGGSADTAVGSLRVTLSASATGIRDTAGNQASFANVTPADRAAPVALSLVSTNHGATRGLAEPGDRVTLTFSEAVAGAPSTTDARLWFANGNTMFDIPGLSSGAFQIGGSNDYIATNSDPAVFSGSPVTLSANSSVITLTLTSAPGASLRTVTQAPRTVQPLIPAATLKDAAGNVAVGAVTIAEGMFF